MSALCLAAVALTVTLPLQSFTLAWTHSIEKVRWEEDYQLVGQTLVLVEARIAGSGAGMEPPAGAVLREGVWHYRPPIAPLPRLQLMRSGFVADYELCTGGVCRTLNEYLGPPDDAPSVNLTVC